MKQLLCYGDSNTWGLIPGTMDRYPLGVRWTSLLQEKLLPHDVRVLEEGLCGRTTAFDDRNRMNLNGLTGLSMVLETHRPIDAAIIMLGTNDCKTCYGLNAGQIAEGMTQCLDRLLCDLDPGRILAVSPIRLGLRIGECCFDPDFDESAIAKTEQLADAYRVVCDSRHIRLLDAGSIAEPSAVDQEHMDEQGHAVFAEAVYKLLQMFNIV